MPAVVLVVLADSLAELVVLELALQAVEHQPARREAHPLHHGLGQLRAHVADARVERAEHVELRLHRNAVARDVRDGEHQHAVVEREHGREPPLAVEREEFLDHDANPVRLDLRVRAVLQGDHEANRGSVHGAVHEVDQETMIGQHGLEGRRPVVGTEPTEREDGVEEPAVLLLRATRG